MQIKSTDVKKLREQTGVGMMDCKNALSEAGGDFDKAVDVLRKKGIAKAAKKTEREAKQGIIECYLHGTKVGVLLELNCETDFVAKNDDFKKLAHEIAMHIAAMNPRYISREDVPKAEVDKEKEIEKEKLKDSGKPKKILDKIVEGKIEKFYEENCLLDQIYIKDDKKKVGDLITDAVAKIGENIKVGRFCRFAIGE